MDNKDNAFIGVLILIGIIWGVFALFGGGTSSEDYSGNMSNDSYTSSYGDEYDYGYEEPENPYDDGSGHSAGYEWAEDNGVDSCGGNSNSFIEGCEEYLEQQEMAGYEDDYYEDNY